MYDRLPSARLVALGLLATAGFALAFGSAPAAAHDHYHAEPYEFTVGWTSEPAIVGAPNGLDLGIAVIGPANSSEPVTGVAQDLTVTLTAGGQSSVRALEPQFGNPGGYTFSFIPTREGAYSVHIVGTLNGTAVDITANLENAEAADEYQFPVADPTAAQLQEQLDDANAALALEHQNATALSARVAALEAQGGSGSASAAASTATLVGLLGLAAGIAGAALGAMAWKGRKRVK